MYFLWGREDAYASTYLRNRQNRTRKEYIVFSTSIDKYIHLSHGLNKVF
jgi:hypothetical protein